MGESSNKLEDGKIDPRSSVPPSVILRSSDGVDLPAHKIVLSLVSPFFRAMFELPQPSIEDGRDEDLTAGTQPSSDPPVIPVSEHSEILKKLLLFCDPGESPILDSVEEMQELMSLATKYDMDGILNRIGSMLSSSTLLEEEPVRVFAIACRFGLSKEANMAAQKTLRFPLHQRHYAPEMESITAGTLYHLQDFYHRSVEATVALTTQFKWITRDSFVWFSTTGHCARNPQPIRIAGGGVSVTPSVWWMEYMAEVGVALRDSPCGATASRPDIVNRALRKATVCSVCRERVFEEIQEFMTLFASELNRVTCNVELGVKF